MKARLIGAAVVVALLATGLAACGRFGSDDPEPSVGATTCLTPYAAGASEHSITSDGQKRSYLVVAPDDRVLTKSMPVVYLFHGLGDSSTDVVDYTKLSTLADERKFLLVAPAATGKKLEWDVSGIAKGEGKDSDFIDDVIAKVGSAKCVDEQRQYAAGLSNGSGVSIALACRGTEALSAYAGVATTFFNASCQNSPPASIIYFHGTADKIVPYNGGKTPAFPVRGVQDVLSDWAEHDGCQATPATKKIGSDVQRQTWTGCSDDARLQAYIVSGGGHTWPDAAVAYPTLGKTTTTIDAADLILDFFDITK